jgi:hypothetical protein
MLLASKDFMCMFVTREDVCHMENMWSAHAIAVIVILDVFSHEDVVYVTVSMYNIELLRGKII